MVLVFIYHSESYSHNGHSYSWIFSPFFLTGFFFVSGYLFTNDITAVSISKKIKQVFRALIIPYLLFELIMLPIKVFTGRSDASQLVWDIILFRNHWFVIVIGVMQLLYAVVLSKFRTQKSLLFSSIIFFIIGLLLCSVYSDTFPYIDAVHNNRLLFSSELPNRMPFCLNMALLYCPFFAIGIFSRQHEHLFYLISGKKYLLPSIISYIVLYCIVDHLFIGSHWCGATSTYHNLSLMMIYAILGIWMLSCISCAVQRIKPINYIGQYSILFAFMNGGSLTVAYALLHIIDLAHPVNYWGQLAVALFSLSIVYLATLFINRFLPILRGDKESFNRLSQKLGGGIKW